MLLTSFYASSLLSVIIIVRFESKIEGRIRNLILRCLFKVRFVNSKRISTSGPQIVVKFPTSANFENVVA